MTYKEARYNLGKLRSDLASIDSLAPEESSFREIWIPTIKKIQSEINRIEELRNNNELEEDVQ